MQAKPGIQTRLIDVADTVLIVIDMQDSFFSKYEKVRSQAVISKAVWLLHVAAKLSVPVIAMAEDIADCGPLTGDISRALPEATRVFDKNVFGLGHQAEILEAVKATGRRTAVLIGTETDVCVAQSALSLMEAGFDVAVVRDATISTAADEDIGLMRIRDAGGVICSVKSLYYEWLRSVSGCVALKEQSAATKSVPLPPGMVL
jgi:nicotinamidase-related amidase